MIMVLYAELCPVSIREPHDTWYL